MIKIISIALVCLLLAEDAALAVDLKGSAATSTLAPTSIFNPIVVLTWDETNSKYVLTENEKEKELLIKGRREDKAFIYLNLLIGQFLHGLKELGRLNVSNAGMQESLERLKEERLAKFIKATHGLEVDFDRFRFREMRWDGNTICLPYWRKDSPKDGPPVIQIMRFYLPDSKPAGHFDRVNIPIGIGDLKVILEDPMAEEGSPVGETAVAGEVPQAMHTDEELAREGLKELRTLIRRLPRELQGRVAGNKDFVRLYTGVYPEIMSDLFSGMPDGSRKILVTAIESKNNFKVVGNHIINLKAASRAIRSNARYFPEDALPDPVKWLVENPRKWILRGHLPNVSSDDEEVILNTRYGILSGYPPSAAEKYIPYNRAIQKSRSFLTLDEDEMELIKSAYIFENSAIRRFRAFSASDGVWARRLHDIFMKALNEFTDIPAVADIFPETTLKGVHSHALVGMLSMPDTREKAMKELLSRGKNIPVFVIKPLVGSLSNSNRGMVSAAIELLLDIAQADPTEVVMSLVGALADSNKNKKFYAEELLLRIAKKHPNEVRRFLAKAIDRDPDQQVKQRAASIDRKIVKMAAKPVPSGSDKPAAAEDARALPTAGQEEAGQIARGDAKSLCEALKAQKPAPLRDTIDTARIAIDLKKIVEESKLPILTKDAISRRIESLSNAKFIEVNSIILYDLTNPQERPSGWLLGFNTMPRAPNAQDNKLENAIQELLRNEYPNTIGLSADVLDNLMDKKSLILEYTFHEAICPHFGHAEARRLAEELFPENYRYVRGDTRAGHRDGALAIRLKRLIAGGRLPTQADFEDNLIWLISQDQTNVKPLERTRFNKKALTERYQPQFDDLLTLKISLKTMEAYVKVFKVKNILRAWRNFTGHGENELGIPENKMRLSLHLLALDFEGNVLPKWRKLTGHGENELGIPEERVRQYPNLLGGSFEEKILPTWKKLTGGSENELGIPAYGVGRSPMLLALDFEGNTQPTYYYMINVSSITKERINSDPTMLSLSLQNRIRPRVIFLSLNGIEINTSILIESNAKFIERIHGHDIPRARYEVFMDRYNKKEEELYKIKNDISKAIPKKDAAAKKRLKVDMVWLGIYHDEYRIALAQHADQKSAEARRKLDKRIESIINNLPQALKPKATDIRRSLGDVIESSNHFNLSYEHDQIAPVPPAAEDGAMSNESPPQPKISLPLTQEQFKRALDEYNRLKNQDEFKRADLLTRILLAEKALSSLRREEPVRISDCLEFHLKTSLSENVILEKLRERLPLLIDAIRKGAIKERGQIFEIIAPSWPRGRCDDYIYIAVVFGIVERRFNEGMNKWINSPEIIFPNNPDELLLRDAFRVVWLSQPFEIYFDWETNYDNMSQQVNIVRSDNELELGPGYLYHGRDGLDEALISGKLEGDIPLCRVAGQYAAHDFNNKSKSPAIFVVRTELFNQLITKGQADLRIIGNKKIGMVDPNPTISIPLGIDSISEIWVAEDTHERYQEIINSTDIGAGSVESVLKLVLIKLIEDGKLKKIPDLWMKNLSQDSQEAFKETYQAIGKYMESRGLITNTALFRRMVRPAPPAAKTGEESRRAENPIKPRFEALRKKYGGKISWLDIMNELGLPKKLDFEIPQYIPFEKEYLRRLHDKYQEAKIDDIYKKIEKSISKTPGQYFGRLYGQDMEDKEFRILVDSLLDNEFKGLLSYGRKDEWIRLFCDIRHSPDVERWKENKKREEPFPVLRVGKIAVDAIEESIKVLIFFNMLTPAEQKEWVEKTKELSLHRIFRSSNFDEDTFETSMAGSYMSKVTDTFRSLYALKRIMDMPDDTVSDRYLRDASYAGFLQEYITGEKSGIVFSDLCGYTSIESVIGEPSMSVAGLNNTIIDVNISGEIEDVNYGFYGEPGAMRWDGFDLRYYCGTEGAGTDAEAVELAQKIWEKRALNITTKAGKVMKSPLSENEIYKVRDVALGIQNALGFPVDLEFVFKNNRLYILQARPITGESSSAPKALPEFQESDVICKVPISIGITPEDGYSGFIVAGIDESVKAKRDPNSFMESLGLRKGEFIIATESPVNFSQQPMLIDSGKASRLYHHGIEFRENGTVVAGIPGVLFKDMPGLHWRKVKVDGIDITISAEKVRYYSNGFKGVLVKDGAAPIIGLPTSENAPPAETDARVMTTSQTKNVPDPVLSAIGRIDGRVPRQDLSKTDSPLRLIGKSIDEEEAARTAAAKQRADKIASSIMGTGRAPGEVYREPAQLLAEQEDASERNVPKENVPEENQYKNLELITLKTPDEIKAVSDRYSDSEDRVRSRGKTMQTCSSDYEQSAVFYKEIEKAMRDNKSEKTSFLPDLKGAGVMIVGPDRYAYEVEALIKLFPQVGEIYIVTVHSDIIVNIDNKLEELKNTGIRIPKVFCHVTNFMELPGELSGKMDLIVAKNVFDINFFTYRMLTQIDDVIARLLKTNGMYVEAKVDRSWFGVKVSSPALRVSVNSDDFATWFYKIASDAPDPLLPLQETYGIARMPKDGITRIIFNDSLTTNDEIKRYIARLADKDFIFNARTEGGVFEIGILYVTEGEPAEHALIKCPRKDYGVIRANVEAGYSSITLNTLTSAIPLNDEGKNKYVDDCIKIARFFIHYGMPELSTLSRDTAETLAGLLNLKLCPKTIGELAKLPLSNEKSPAPATRAAFEVPSAALKEFIRKDKIASLKIENPFYDFESFSDPKEFEAFVMRVLRPSPLNICVIKDDVDAYRDSFNDEEKKMFAEREYIRNNFEIYKSKFPDKIETVLSKAKLNYHPRLHARPRIIISRLLESIGDFCIVTIVSSDFKQVIKRTFGGGLYIRDGESLYVYVEGVPGKASREQLERVAVILKSCLEDEEINEEIETALRTTEKTPDIENVEGTRINEYLRSLKEVFTAQASRVMTTSQTKNAPDSVLSAIGRMDGRVLRQDLPKTDSPLQLIGKSINEETAARAAAARQRANEIASSVVETEGAPGEAYREPAQLPAPQADAHKKNVPIDDAPPAAEITVDLDREKIIVNAFCDTLIGRVVDANEKGQSIVLGLEESWMPQGFSQPRLVVEAIERLKIRLEKAGYRNFEFIHGKGDIVADEILAKRSGNEKAIPLSNIIVLGGQAILSDDSSNKFNELTSSDPKESALFVGVDNTEMSADTATRIPEMFLYAMALARGATHETLDQLFIQITPAEGRQRAFIFKPIRPIDILKFEAATKLHIREIDTKA